MHPAWYVDDILLPIVELLEPGDLARLARTNKIMFDWATDRLWGTIHSLIPLMHCLPVEVESRELQLEEIVRLDLYARKVKVIVLEGRDTKNLIGPPYAVQRSEEDGSSRCWRKIWANIAQLRPNTLFLPNLERLRVHNVVDELLLPLVGIAGSHLTSIYIRHVEQAQPAHIVRAFLDQLQDTSRLEYLFVYDGEPDVVPSKLIKQPPLKHLRLDPEIKLSGDHASHEYKESTLRVEVMQKSTLESLNIGLTRDWYSLGLQYADHKHLPGLRSLRLNLRGMEVYSCSQQCINQDRDNWTCSHHSFDSDEEDLEVCQRRSPAYFFQGLDSPKLDVLKISFPFHVTGAKLLEVVQAASTNCLLSDLSELSLAGGRLIIACQDCGVADIESDGKIEEQDLRDAMTSLLPLNRLRSLRLTVGPSFLQSLDLEFYKAVADGLPALQTLALGYGEFEGPGAYLGNNYVERVPVPNIAAFGHMIPTLVNVEMGCVDGEMSLSADLRTDWICPNVKTLLIREWIHWRGFGRRQPGSRLSEESCTVEEYKEQLLVCLQTYFPAVCPLDLTDDRYHPTFRRVF